MCERQGYAARWAATDDLVAAVKAMTTYEQQPHLHYWDRHPGARSWAPAEIAKLHQAVADAVRPAFEAVIADHVESATRVVLEGDYLVPELQAAFGDAVRAVVLDELDVERLVDNYRAREPGNGEQRYRAQVSTQVGAQLAQRATRCRIPVVTARPWTDCIDRLDRALRT